MNKNKKAEVNILKSICVHFLQQEGDIIELNANDILFINSCLKKIAEYEKRLLDEKYSNSSSYNLDFDFEYERKQQRNGYFMGYPDKCFIRLRSGKYKMRDRFTKDEFAKLFLEQLNTLFHEFNHFEQLLVMKSEDHLTYNSYRMATEKIFRNKHSSYYNYNYWNILAELDSRLAGMEKVEDLINMIDGFDKSKILLKENIRISDPDNYIKNIHEIVPKTIDGRTYQDQEIFRNQQLDSIIIQNPQYLKEYPVLQYRYNENGNKKDILEQINSLHNIPKNFDSRMVIEFLTDAVEEAEVSQLVELDNVYPDSKSLYDFLYKGNQTRYEQEKAMLQKIEKILAKSLKYDDKFIISKLKTLLDDKYQRRFKMLDMYKNKKYQEGYNIINYQTINGVDLPYEEIIDIEQFENKVSAVASREHIIDVYNKTESDDDFYNRNVTENTLIKFVLSAIQTKRVPKEFLDKFSYSSDRYTLDNFKILACLLKVADSLTLIGDRNIYAEFYSIPQIKNLCEKMQKSKIYQSLSKQAEVNPCKVKQTMLDYYSNTANNYLNTVSNPSRIINEMQNLDEINSDESSEKHAIFRIICKQNGYQIKVKGSKICKRDYPVYIENRKKLNPTQVVGSLIYKPGVWDEVNRLDQLLEHQNNINEEKGENNK